MQVKRHYDFLRNANIISLYNVHSGGGSVKKAYIPHTLKPQISWVIV